MGETQDLKWKGASKALGHVFIFKVKNKNKDALLKGMYNCCDEINMMRF